MYSHVILSVQHVTYYHGGGVGQRVVYYAMPFVSDPSVHMRHLCTVTQLILTKDTEVDLLHARNVLHVLQYTEPPVFIIHPYEPKF